MPDQEEEELDGPCDVLPLDEFVELEDVSLLGVLLHALVRVLCGVGCRGFQSSHYFKES
jgi:hypothetical protein